MKKAYYYKRRVVTTIILLLTSIFVMAIYEIFINLSIYAFLAMTLCVIGIPFIAKRYSIPFFEYDEEGIIKRGAFSKLTKDKKYNWKDVKSIKTKISLFGTWIIMENGDYITLGTAGNYGEVIKDLEKYIPKKKLDKTTKKVLRQYKEKKKWKLF